MEVQQIFIHHPARSRSACKIFIANPPLDREIRFGKLFGIIEIRSFNRKNYRFIDYIFTELENHYYQYEQESPEINWLTESKIESTLEHALQMVNQKIVEFSLREKINLEQIKLNMVVGVISSAHNLISKSYNLSLASCGTMQAFLICPVSQNVHKIIDIFANVQGTKENLAHPMKDKFAASSAASPKFFTAVTSGKVQPFNYLIFCNDSFFDYLALEELKNIVVSAPLSDAIADLTDHLSQLDPQITFAALFLQIPPKQQVAFAQKMFSPQESITLLESTEIQTSALLTPSLGLNFKAHLITLCRFLRQTIKSIFLLFRKILHRDGWQYKKMISSLARPKISWPAVKWPHLSAIQEMGLKIYQILSSFASALLQKIILGFNRLPRKSKIFSIFCLIVLLLFIHSIALLAQQRTKKIEDRAEQSLLQLIQEKKSLAESKLLYQETAAARILLTELQPLLAAFPQETRQQRATYRSLAEEIQVLSEKARLVTNVSNPTLLADLSSVSAKEFQHLFLSKNNVFAINDEGKIFQITSGQSSLSSTLPLSPAKIIPTKEGVFIALNQNSILEIEPNEKKIRAVELILASPEEKIQDLAFYINKLYVLDSQNQQIFRHPASASGFAKGSAWLREANPQLSDAIALAIDGVIYVLKKNGEVTQFIAGYQQLSFSLTPPDPAFQEPLKIFTAPESTRLYIFEPKQKRIVVFKKNGEMTNQYLFPAVQQITDFAIDEKNKKLLLLADNKIYAAAFTETK